MREGRNIILRSQSIEFSDSFCLRILLINIAIESVHCDYERNVCWDGTRLVLCGKLIQPHWRMNIVREWYSQIYKLFQYSTSHWRDCELNRNEAKGERRREWALVCMSVVFLFTEAYRLVLSCTLCSIICEVRTSKSLPGHYTLALQRGIHDQLEYSSFASLYHLHRFSLGTNCFWKCVL